MNGANFRGTRFVHVAALFAALGSLFQLAVAAGIVSAYLVDYAFATVGGWRWMLGLAVAPALVFGAGMFFLPETPIWLIRSGRHEIARSVLLRIRDNADVDLEIAEIQTSLAQMTIVAMLLVDRAGRRPLLLIGIAGMIVTLAVLAFGFHGTNQSNNLAWIAVICLMSYVASFAVSLGPIFWLLIAEIYPLKVGGLAEGTAATFN